MSDGRGNPVWSFLRSWLILALGILLAAAVVPGIDYDQTETLLVVVLVLSLFNAFLRPLLVLFALPFVVLTFGLGLVLINAGLFALAGYLIEGFTVSGFWPALGGAVITGIIGGIANAVLGLQQGRVQVRVRKRHHGPRGGVRNVKRKDDDVIDV